MKKQTSYVIAGILSSVTIVGFAILAASSGNAAGSPAILPAQSFMQTFQSAPGAVLIDVRTPSEYQAGHIAGAINIDQENPSFGSNVAQLDPSKSYFLYCHSGRRSALAAATMQSAGFTHLYELQGGLNAAPQLLSQ